MTDYIPPETEGYTVPRFPDKASGMAITALVLGILALPCCCGFLAGIPALVVGFMEKGKIARHESSDKGQWMALVGIVMGIISLIFGCLQIVWVIFFGGLGILQGLAEQAH
jgi:hypothetical protein